MEPRPRPVRVALRAVHAALPEAAATLEAHFDQLEARIVHLSAEDPYRALVLDLHETMVRVDSGLLADVARIEAGRVEKARLDAEREARPTVWSALFTPPVLVVLLPLLLGSGGIGGLIVRYILMGKVP